MSGWISKAANVFKREVPEVQQPFEVLCECGQSHAGIRRNRHQHLLCKSCGASLFVLPRDVYPPPLQVPPPDAKPDSQEEQEDGSGTDRERKPRKSNNVAVPAPRRKQRGSKRRGQDKGDAEEKSRRKSGSEEPGLLSRAALRISRLFLSIWLTFRRFWTPFRTIALVVLGVMVFTAGWTVRQSLLSSAVIAAKARSESGMAAIEKQEWLQARDELQAATAALDRLGRTDPDAIEIRQYYRETRALTRLCTVSLGELLASAENEFSLRDEKVRKGDDRGKDLATRFRGEWLVIEGVVKPVPPADAGGRRHAYVLTLPWSPAGGGERVLIRADFPVFDELQLADSGQTLIFSGAIESCQRNEQQREWIVWLQPSSGFLWTHMATYRALGFDFDGPLAAQTVVDRLQKQAQAIGMTP